MTAGAKPDAPAAQGGREDGSRDAVKVNADHRAIIRPDTNVAAPEVSAQDQIAYARSRVGRILNDRWHLDGLLGIGGMASVYSATHRNGNRVAIKVLHPELSGYEELKERFLEEGYAANNVAHPGVVAVHDDGISEDGAVFLVMELLEGETLQARWQRAPFAFTPRDALSLADQILEVLEAAHRKGIIHRDIKPENVFLTREGRVKLLDFGIAHNEHSRRTHRTRAGSAMGTPAFMPPEQARGHADQIDGRTDIWALGATLFLLASGRFVRSEATSNEELLAAMTRPAARLRAVAPHAPLALAHLIDTALAFDKKDRFDCASAMRVAVWETYAALDVDAALPPLDLSVQMAAVLLSADDESGSPPESLATYRPVTSSASAPSVVEASPRPRSRGRRLVMLGLGAALGVAVVSALVIRNEARRASQAFVPAALPVAEPPPAGETRTPSTTPVIDNRAGSEAAVLAYPAAPAGEVSSPPLVTTIEADAGKSGSSVTKPHTTASSPRRSRAKRGINEPTSAKARATVGSGPSSPSTASAGAGQPAAEGPAAASPRDPLSRRK